MHKLIKFALSSCVMLVVAACTTTAGFISAQPGTPTALVVSKESPLITSQPVDSPVILWQRSGGIAGICQQLFLFHDGSYKLVNCTTGIVLQQGQLSNDQWKPFSDLLNQYSKFRWEVTLPPNSADMFMDKYSFTGKGTTVPTVIEQNEINGELTDLADTLASTEPVDNSSSDRLASGIQGQVVIGPTCPGPVPAEPAQATNCADKPYQATITVLDQKNQEVTTFETDADGKFYITLDPGTYTLQADTMSNRAFPRAKPQVVTVTAGNYTEITIMLDTGIR
jgi:hypothetical protein